MSMLFSLPRLATRWGVGRTDGWHFRLHWRRIRILELNFAGSFIRGRWRKCALKKFVEAERWRNGRHRQSDKTAARRKRKSCWYNSAGICWQVRTNSVSPSQEMAVTASCRLMGIECECLRFFFFVYQACDNRWRQQTAQNRIKWNESSPPTGNRTSNPRKGTRNGGST